MKKIQKETKMKKKKNENKAKQQKKKKKKKIKNKTNKRTNQKKQLDEKDLFQTHANSTTNRERETIKPNKRGNILLNEI